MSSSKTRSVFRMFYLRARERDADAVHDNERSIARCEYLNVDRSSRSLAPPALHATPISEMVPLMALFPRTVAESREERGENHSRVNETSGFHDGNDKMTERFVGLFFMHFHRSNYYCLLFDGDE